MIKLDFLRIYHYKDYKSNLYAKFTYKGFSYICDYDINRLWDLFLKTRYFIKRRTLQKCNIVS